MKRDEAGLGWSLAAYLRVGQVRVVRTRADGLAQAIGEPQAGVRLR